MDLAKLPSLNPINLDYSSKIAKLPSLKSPENGQSSGKNKLKEVSKAYKINISSEDHLERHPSLTKIYKQKSSLVDYNGKNRFITQNSTSESEHKLLKPSNILLAGSGD